jgi:hypothetical protein
LAKGGNPESDLDSSTGKENVGIPERAYSAGKGSIKI